MLSIQIYRMPISQFLYEKELPYFLRFENLQLSLLSSIGTVARTYEKPLETPNTPLSDLSFETIEL